MKKWIRILTTIILSSTSGASIIACNNTPDVLLQKYDILTFSEIKGINIETFDKKSPFIFFKIDKKNVINSIIPDDINSLYETVNYIYFVVDNNNDFKQILNVYKLNENSTEKEIKDKLSTTAIKNCTISVYKRGAPYFNVVIGSFLGTII